MHTGGTRQDALKRRSGPKSKTSCFLGVTQYKRTGRWEAHIWDSGDPEFKKGRQLHLGSFPAAIPAAIAYDRAAYIIKPRNVSRNFPQTDYARDEFILANAHLSKLEFVSKLRLWAQDPALAAEYLGFGRRPVPPQPQAPATVPKPVVLKHSALQHAALGQSALQAPLRESRAAAGSLAPRPPEPLPSPQRPGPATPAPFPPLANARGLPLPVALPVSRRPRSKRYTCARPNIQPIPIKQEPVRSDEEELELSESELEELRTSPEGPAPALALLLMATKAAEEAEAEAAKPATCAQSQPPEQPTRQPLQLQLAQPRQQQQPLKQQAVKQPLHARQHPLQYETAAENMRRRRHPDVQPRKTWTFQELPESFLQGMPAPRPLAVAEWTG